MMISLNVKIVATHAGISVGGDGASHQMLEDIALMRVLPNMLVVTPTDATEIEDIIPQVAKHPGPCYVRMGRADSPVIFEKHGDLILGKAKILEDGNDVTLIGTGTMVSETLRAHELLKKHKIDARVILIHTLKPIDQDTLKKAARETGCIITAEEHSIIGGLGSAVSEALNMCPVPLKRIGVPDVFGESGEAEDLVKKYGLTAENISEAAQELVRLK